VNGEGDRRGEKTVECGCKKAVERTGFHGVLVVFSGFRSR
jgi:hypothetical protein